tara:strand:+ start:551 stop:1369 length:819 start_codon:yes stop_codon:yes gene_type:complete
MLKSRENYEIVQYCNNCGKRGHTYNQCSKPITSVGLIVMSKEYNKIKYLMICRKDSLGYVEFLRGKYNVFDKNYIQNLVDEMTIYEKKNILTKSFSVLWNDLWGKFSHTQYRQEEKSSSEKFSQLKKGILDIHSNKMFSIETLINESTTNWKYPEWGFPKGRRNYQETDLVCALREFQEETGYHKKEINIISNLKPFQEIFTGSNYKSYKHKYFLGYIHNPIVHNNFQKSEVSDMKWLSLEDCLKKIRPYNLERIELINNINKVLHKYSLIS